ncbi:MAG TPA: hypothetical protein VFL38_05555 [Humibacillus xanthopallidus]|nr:hypothetical protein [Humibacillus xanthopallidus]
MRHTRALHHDKTRLAIQQRDGWFATADLPVRSAHLIATTLNSASA